MSLDNRPQYSGGCQCGAVRFRVEGALGDASICHCRMCQKAAGNFYLPLVSVRQRKAHLDARRAEEIPFIELPRPAACCAECGTPLTYRGAGWDRAGDRRLRRSLRHRACHPVGHRGEAALRRRDPGLPGQDTMAGHGRRAIPRRPRLLPAPRPRHRRMAAERWKSHMSAEAITGGCQCGAVRFRAEGLGRASICHCRMCQEQFGSFYGPFVTGIDGHLGTRGHRSTSSPPTPDVAASAPTAALH